MKDENIFQKLINILQNVHDGIEQNKYESTIDIFQAYTNPDVFSEIKMKYEQLKKKELAKQKTRLDKDHIDIINNNIEQENKLNELDSIFDEDDEIENLTNQENEKDQSEIYSKLSPFILQSQEVAAKFAQMVSKGVAASTNSFSSYNKESRDREGGREGGSSYKKKRSKSGSAFPLNWGLIVSMASNITLDQVKSMLGLLIMVLQRTPVAIILKELHRYRMLVSIIYDLIGAIHRRDPKEVATQIIIATFAVISFTNKHDKFLSTVLSVSKYIHSTGAKKKFLFVRLLTLGLFLTNLFKIVNPPPITPLDLVQIVKSQISSKL